MEKILPGILLFISCYSCSQVQLKPSKDMVDYKWVKSTVFTARMYILHDTAREEMGTTKISIEVKKAEDKIYIISESRLKSTAGKIRMDTSVFRYVDMSPLYFASHNTMYDMGVHFEKGKATGYHKQAEKDPAAINETTQGDFFDPNSYPTILSWLTELKEGFTADLPVYNLYEQKVVTSHLRKVESAKVGNKNVWKLSVDDEIFPEIKTSYYFDKVTRKHLKVEQDYGDSIMLIIMD